MTPDTIISLLNLNPLPLEGGYYRETYRSTDKISPESLGIRYPSARSLCTAIYYLLTPDTVSTMHRLPGDEIFHFYIGDPVEMLLLNADGSSEVVALGNDLLKGHHPQFVVPSGVWQGARLFDGGKFALMGTTMSAGFEFEDYEAGMREELVGRYPLQKTLIEFLTYAGK